MSPAAKRGLALALVAGVVCAAAGLYVASTTRRGGSEGAPPGGVPVGEVAPAFDLERLEPGRLNLADLRGKIVYVHFWATWCAPCRVEIPALERMYEELHRDGFELISVTIDDAGDTEKVRAFRDEFGMSFPILRDPDRKVYSRYGATGVPETYLIDAEGRLVEAYIGPRDWSEPRYARTVRRLLDELQRGAGAAE